MDIGLFRTEFPEFADTVTYPETMIQFEAGIAEIMLPLSVWTTMWETGVKLYVAHEITLAAQNSKVSKFGGAPGTFGGVPSNKTVGSATIQYDSQSTTEKDAGYWNLTNYGKRLYRFIRLFGAGCVQL